MVSGRLAVARSQRQQGGQLMWPVKALFIGQAFLGCQIVLQVKLDLDQLIVIVFKRVLRLIPRVLK